MVDDRDHYGSEQDEEIVVPKKKPIILFVAIAAVAAIGLGGILFGLVRSCGMSAADGSRSPEATAAVNGGEDLPEGMVAIGPVYKLENLLFNLADENERRYLKATIELEICNPALIPEVEKRLPKIRDALIALVSSKTSSEIQTPEGQLLLRQQIAKRLASILGQGTVKDVYLTQFLIQ